MNFKRKRPKNARAGCLMCKPWKMNGWGNKVCCWSGNGRRLEVAKDTLRRFMRGQEV